MGLKNFIKEAIEEEKNKTPEQKQMERDEKANKKLEKICENYSDYLLDDEAIIFHTSNIKGTFLFLDERILFHDDRLRKGSKQEYHTIPYKNIKRFTIEKAGIADLDTDIKLFLGGGQLESITIKVPIDSTKTINKIILSKIL
ncbi:PH domain-containing protein [Paraclostridium bifermentans]|uniref:PH domain-containing protein n=1 Tax=Paraclostridium bifermentans TaxID=1490 RepID=UPI00189B63AD|nr:PH domain-containing protein [Paraclostridium bifermentans]